MAFLAAFIGRQRTLSASRWRPPVEMLEDRRLLSASVQGSGHDAVVTATPIVVPLQSPITALAISAVDSVPFSGPVGIWKTVSGLPKAGSGLQADASIEWGDGTSSAGAFVQDGNGIVQIDGSHTYAKPGTFNTLVNVIERPVGKPGQPTPQFIIEVGQSAGKATVAKQTQGSVTIYPKVNFPFSGPVADLNFNVPPAGGVGQYTASIGWGDGKTSAGTFSSPTPTADSVVSGTHTYKKAGEFNIHVVVTYGPTPGSGAEFPTRIVATIDSTAFVSKVIIGLNGTIAGTYKPAPVVPDIGATYVFNGTGIAGAMGAVAVGGSVTLPGFIASGHATGTLTLSTISASPLPGGTVTLKLTGPTEKGFGPFPMTLNYVMTGGTGVFANDTSSGTIAVTLDSKGLAFAFVINSILPPV